MRLRSQGADSRLEAFVLAGDISAESWIRTLLQDQLPAQSYGRLLLLPGSKAPVALASRGRQVCACFNVSEPQIRETLAGCRGGDDQRLAELQQALKCGTNCGSCIPELKRMVRSTALAA
jgi:assimilatory nitrate reductase catalytic subunit